MITLVDPNDTGAMRNKDNVLALYDLMINGKKSEEGTAKFVSPTYVQHNPLIADGSDALGKYFGQVTRQRAKARVVVHRIIAVGDYVWAHVNFLNLFNDDPEESPGSTSTEWMPTARRSSTGTCCSWSATRKTPPLGSHRMCPAPIHTGCSEKVR
jgi:predicted SnoaL-like aldol condensation-catalyzing enzyme